MPDFLNKDSIANILTILVFLGGIIWNSHKDRAQRNQAIKDEATKQKKMRMRYLMALKEEIKINVKGVDKLISMSPATDKINAFLREDKQNRVIITYSYFSTVFSTRTEVLQDLEEKIINGIVDFYGKLDELKVDVDAVESKAFITISHESRAKCFQQILEEAKLVQQQGSELIRLIEIVLDDGSDCCCKKRAG